MTELERLRQEVDQLKAYFGIKQVEGDETLARYGTRQLSQLTDEQFLELRADTSTMPNGEDNLAIDLALKNRLIRDQRQEINALTERVKALEARPTGSVTPAPQPSPSIDIQALVQQLQPFFNNGTLSVGNVPGFGVGMIGRTTGGHCFVIFTTDYDRAFRILPNLDPDRPEWGFTADPDLTNPRLEYEQNAMWSMSMHKPFNAPAGQYDWRPDNDPMGKGKHLVFRVGGNAPNGQVGPNCEVYGGLLKRNMVFGVSRTHPNVLDPVPGPNGTMYGDFHIDGINDSANPIMFTAGGRVVRVIIRVVNGVEVLSPA